MFEDSAALPLAGGWGCGRGGRSVYFKVWYRNTVRMSVPVQSVHQYVCVPRPLRSLRLREFGLIFEGFPFKLIVGMCRTESLSNRDGAARPAGPAWLLSVIVVRVGDNLKG